MLCKSYSTALNLITMKDNRPVFITALASQQCLRIRLCGAGEDLTTKHVIQLRRIMRLALKNVRSDL